MPAATASMTMEQRALYTWEDHLKAVPFDAFAQKTLQAGLNDRAMMMVASYGEKQSGLAGKVQQLYRVLFYSLQAGPKAPNETNE